jgi:hypothetical protein
MYLLIVLLTMVLLPLGSIGWEHFVRGAYLQSPVPLLLLAGKWFVFWAVGVRLVLAGVRQFFDPRFTAAEIFKIRGDEALPIVRELGVANFAAGVVAAASLARPRWVLPMAIIGAIFYGVAGICHLIKGAAGRNETIAMVSDLFVFAVLLAYLAFTIFR